MTMTEGGRAARVPQTTPDRSAQVFGEELDALLRQLRELDDSEWARPTDCTAWTVRDVVAHLAGACEEGTRLRVMLRHAALAGRRYPDRAWLDGVNQLQLDDRTGSTTADLVTELSRVGPAAARARRRLPGLLRGRAVPARGGLPRGATFGYLVDVIYPRDLWMHRVDIGRATGRDLAATGSQAEVVAQVVRDLDRAWDGPTCTLVLTGPGGGRWQLGEGVPSAQLTADAVDICRLLSGRAGSPVIDCDGDPRAVARLVASRVVF